MSGEAYARALRGHAQEGATFRAGEIACDHRERRADLLCIAGAGAWGLVGRRSHPRYRGKNRGDQFPSQTASRSADEISLGCARRFKNESAEAEGKPFLLLMNLSKARCS